MHQSLYRKYRPSNFDEVVGQKVIIQTLKNAIKNNTLSHAYLFAGPRGTGKTSIAKILAKTVNCTDLKEYNPCDKCVNCTQYNNKQAIDIIEIDAASNNGVDEIRELKSKINLVPTIGKYKIYIIDEVHMLSTGAFNALLKTLEEPPSHIIFILATTDPHKIPQTILSRCQRFDFKKISIESIKDRLNYVIKEEKIKIDKEAIEEIAYLSDGGMRDALSLLDQAVSYSTDKISLEDIHEINGTITTKEMHYLLELLLNKNLKDIFTTIDRYNSLGKDFYKLTEELILYLRNILIIKTVPDYLENKTDYDVDIRLDELIKYIKEFNNSLIDMKNTSNQKLILELSIIKILNIEVNNNQEDKKIKESTMNKAKLDEIPSTDQIKKMNKIRINNTLCKFNKKEYLEFKDTMQSLEKYLVDKKYSEFVSLILDGDIKAYGLNNFIIVFKNNNDVLNFNSHYKIIDELFVKEYNKRIKGTSVDINTWEKIKQEFNNKEKEYKYIEEEDE